MDYTAPGQYDEVDQMLNNLVHPRVTISEELEKSVIELIQTQIEEELASRQNKHLVEW